MGQVVFEQTGGPFLSIYDSNCRNSCLFTVRGQRTGFYSTVLNFKGELVWGKDSGFSLIV